MFQFLLMIQGLVKAGSHDTWNCLTKLTW